MKKIQYSLSLKIREPRTKKFGSEHRRAATSNRITTSLPCIDPDNSQHRAQMYCNTIVRQLGIIQKRSSARNIPRISQLSSSSSPRSSFCAFHLHHVRTKKLALVPSTHSLIKPPSIAVRLSSSTNSPSSTLPTSPPALPAYTPPSSGILSLLPSRLVPYGELIRLDKPTGTYYLFLPCLFSTLLFALPAPLADPTTVLSTTALFLTGAFIMRSAGCTVNDLWDRNFDPLVTRTRHRPIARGAISPRAGLAFFLAQCVAGFGLLVQLPPACLAWGVPSLLLVATYPLAKRVTHYPQVVLGLTFSWGALMGGPALGWEGIVDTGVGAAAAALYASCGVWTVLYDWVYAHQDVKDDVGAGVKSIAVRHGPMGSARTKVMLAGLAAVQVGLLGVAGGMMGGMGWPFWVGSVGGGAVSLAVMIRRVRLESVSSCWWWFRNGCLLTGGAIGAGLGGEYVRRLGEEKAEGEERERREVPESAWRWILRSWRER